jgi:hypothetical protein
LLGLFALASNGPSLLAGDALAPLCGEARQHVRFTRREHIVTLRLHPKRQFGP